MLYQLSYTHQERLLPRRQHTQTDQTGAPRYLAATARAVSLSGPG